MIPDWLIGLYKWAEPFLFYVYWIPLMFSALYFTIKTIRDVKSDIDFQNNHGPSNSMIYHDFTTVGDLVGYVLLSIIPAVNWIPMVFFSLPEIYNFIVKFCGKFLDIRLVPRKK